MRTLLFESLVRRPLTEARARARRRGARRARRSARPRGAAPARPQPVDPRGRCRLLQRLRAGNPRAQQRVLRPRALRPALRRLAAPCRRAAGDRAGDQEHARGAGAHLRRDARSEMGGGGRRLRASTAACSPAATPCVGGVVAGGAGRPAHPRLPAAPDRSAERPAGADGEGVNGTPRTGLATTAMP